MSAIWPQAHRSAALTNCHGLEVARTCKPAGKAGRSSGTSLSTSTKPSSLLSHHCVTSDILSLTVTLLEQNPKASALLLGFLTLICRAPLATAAMDSSTAVRNTLQVPEVFMYRQDNLCLMPAYTFHTEMPVEDLCANRWRTRPDTHLDPDQRK